MNFLNNENLKTTKIRKSEHNLLNFNHWLTGSNDFVSRSSKASYFLWFFDNFISKLLIYVLM